MSIFVRTFLREMKLFVRSPADVLNPVVFYLIVISLFPLGLGPGAQQLAAIAPGVIWIALLLATLMSIDVMFRSDYLDGTLEQMVTGRQPLYLIVLGKIVGHWILCGLPLLMMTPVVALVLFVDYEGMALITWALLLVTPTLSLIGSIAAALTVGLARGGLLITILVLPLYVPVLILGVLMVNAGMAGQTIAGYAYWLVAILLLSLGLAPLATVAGVRLAAQR